MTISATNLSIGDDGHLQLLSPYSDTDFDIEPLGDPNNTGYSISTNTNFLQFTLNNSNAMTISQQDGVRVNYKVFLNSGLSVDGGTETNSLNVSGKTYTGSLETTNAKIYSGGNLFIQEPNGLILKDSDGNGCHKILVNSSGTITATSVSCPQ
jgi:hypothetical protein